MKKKSVGIWGYGVVGASVEKHFTNQQAVIHIMDEKYTNIADKTENSSGRWYDENACGAFFDAVDFFIPSPGVDVTKFDKIPREKMVTELDLFYQTWNKKIIGITGSVGKTTVTTFLSFFLEQYKLPIATGGNIGKPMLELLEDETAKTALLELSSFQLEHTKQFAPDVAVWTNFYPNHLDRHKTAESYFLAKYQLIKKQTETDLTIVPTSLIPWLEKYGYGKSRYVFLQDDDTATPENGTVYFVRDSQLFKKTGTATAHVIDLHSVPAITHTQNWIIIAATLSELNLLKKDFVTLAQQLTPVEHRMQTIIKTDKLHVINDSKSTTVASTEAAVTQFTDSNIILLLGGLSKGVDRTPLIEKIKDKVKHVITFGREAFALQKICIAHNVASTACTELKPAIKAAYQKSLNTNEQTVILFSPSGSSFDLFSDYKQRGHTFIEMIRQIIRKN